MEIPKYIDGIPIDEYRVNMTKISKEKLIELYKIKQKPIKQIAKYFKCSYRTIYRRLKRLNIPLNENQGRRKKPPKRFLGKKQLAEILKKDYTIEEIAKKLRTETYIVRRYITKYGL
jgi:transposase